MIFQDPFFLWCVPLVWVYGIYRYRKGHRGGTALLFSDLRLFDGVGSVESLFPEILLGGMRLLCLSLILVGLARPKGRGEMERMTEGIDIMLAIDVSGSMKSVDFKPHNRLDAAKAAVKDFIENRKNDRIGMVIFGTHAFTQCPLTMDYDVLLSFVEELRVGMVDDESTAIGTALAISAERLRNSPAESKVIILLTDGRNNAGRVDPITAAKAAEALDIRVYTIGAGSPEGGMMPVDHPIWGRQYVPVENDIDEETLRKIAEMTGGIYRRAVDLKSLREIYGRISEMETTEISFLEYTEERAYPWFILLPLALLLFETLLRHTVYRRIP